MPRVSFIVAVYNSMPYLTQCLDSLLAQTISDIEVICVNDCSPDNSLEVIKEYASKDSRVRWVNHKTNKRQGGAWNSGVEVATGEYLCFVDADDWLEHDYCEVLNTNDADIFCAKRYYASDLIRYNIVPSNLARCNNDIRLNILLNGCFFITNFYKRSFFERIAFRFIENNMYQDFLTFTLYFRTDKIKLFDNIGYHYRVDNVSITRSMNRNGFWARLDAAKIEYDAFSKIPIYIDYKDAIDIHIYYLFYRNSLMNAFYGYTELPWEKIKYIKTETAKMFPQIKKNPYYKQRFFNIPLRRKMPVVLFERTHPFIVSLLHKVYLLIRKVLKK